MLLNEFGFVLIVLNKQIESMQIIVKNKYSNLAEFSKSWYSHAKALNSFYSVRRCNK